MFFFFYSVLRTCCLVFQKIKNVNFPTPLSCHVTYCAGPCSFRQVGQHAVLTKLGRCWPDAGNGIGTLKEQS